MLFDTKVLKNSVNNDNYNYNYNIFNNHSASGLLCKSMIKSKIIRFDKGSQYEKEFFSEEPYIAKKVNKTYYSGGTYETEEKIKIVVLQVLLVNDSRFIIEYITEDDFNAELGLEENDK